MAHVIPEQLRKAFDAQPGDSITVHSPEHRRAFCYVDDAVEMLGRMAANENCEGVTLNLGTQTPEVTIREVVQTCVEVSRKSLSLEELPPTIGSPERRAPDMKKANRLLEYESQVRLRCGIEKTWNWYCNNVFKSGGLTAQ